ncbi:MAG: VTT domain-containing protein [Archaeoglobaceae archaeon]
MDVEVGPIFAVHVLLIAVFSFRFFGAPDLTRFKGYVSPSPLAGLVIILLLISDLVTPVPSSVLMTLAGSLYGVFWGTVIGSSGSLLASITGFYLVRKLGEGRLRSLITEEEIISMNDWFHHWGEGIVIISRMVPIVAETMSCFAGLTSISFKRFLVLLLLGTTPISFYYSYFGSRSQTVSEWSLPLVLGVTIPGALWIALHLENQLQKAGP